MCSTLNEIEKNNTNNLNHNNNRILHVGVCYAGSKVDKFLNRGVFHSPNPEKLQYLIINNPAEIDQIDPKPDILLIKLTGMQTKAVFGNDANSRQILARLQQFIDNNPNILVIDDMNSVNLLMDRVLMYNLLASSPFTTKHTHKLVRTPHSVMITTPLSVAEYENVDIAGIRFPVICKPIEACETQLSHTLIIVPSIQHLVDLPAGNWLMQEYVNHNAIIFKVYVLGEKTLITARRSLTNISNHSNNSRSHPNSPLMTSISPSPLTSNNLSANILNENKISPTNARVVENYTPVASIKLVQPNNKYYADISDTASITSNPLQSPFSAEFLSPSNNINHRNLLYVPFDEEMSYSHQQQLQHQVRQTEELHLSSNSADLLAVCPTLLQTASRNVIDPTLSQAFDGPKGVSEVLKHVRSYDKEKVQQQPTPESIDAQATPRTVMQLDKTVAEDIEEMSLYLGRCLGLTMFGYDVCISSELGNDAANYYIVDINYMPTYDNVQDFPQQLRTFIRNYYQKHIRALPLSILTPSAPNKV
jgi:inositol-1,3,4-trisphosphate 5/6-kinase/inositol-tetrakisphosphate 1-kinase